MARENAGKPITLGLQRDGKPVTVTYAPSGATVPAWRWERTPAAATADCKL